MDKLYGDYDKVYEKYRNNNLYRRRNEKEEFNKVDKKNKMELKKEKDNNKKDKKMNKKMKKENGDISDISQNIYTDISYDYVDAIRKNKKGRKKKDNSRDLSFNEYKIRKKLSIEINKKIYSDSENVHVHHNTFVNKNQGINENNYVPTKKKKLKYDDQKVKKMLNKKDRTKFVLNFFFVLYYIFYFFHYVIDLQLNNIYNIVLNTFTIVIITSLLLYIYFLKARNKKLKKIILYINAYINLIYCFNIYNTLFYWLHIYLNFTLSKRIYLKYKTLYKNISFVFSYFSFDEIFFFLIIFYGFFSFTSTILTLTLFYYIYNFINYNF